MYINRRILPSQILGVKSLTAANVGSDHNLLVCEFRMKAQSTKKRKPLYIDEYNIEAVEDESTWFLYQSRLAKIIFDNQITPSGNVEAAGLKIKK